MTNVLDMGQLEWVELPNGDKQSIRFNAGRGDDIKSREDLKLRIHQFIHVMSMENVPLSLNYINKKFMRVSKKYETNVNELMSNLLYDKVIEQIDHGGKTAFYSSKTWNEKVDYSKNNNKPFNASMVLETLFSHLDGRV